jgi:selenocysteine lyase/cysteine desulfurase
MMAKYIQQSKDIIRKSFNARNDDSIIFTGHGSSTAIVHFIHASNCKECEFSTVFITDYEHNSIFLPWKCKNIDLVIVPTSSNGLININEFSTLNSQLSTLN